MTQPLIDIFTLFGWFCLSLLLCWLITVFDSRKEDWYQDFKEQREQDFRDWKNLAEKSNLKIQSKIQH